MIQRKRAIQKAFCLQLNKFSSTFFFLQKNSPINFCPIMFARILSDLRIQKIELTVDQKVLHSFFFAISISDHWNVQNNEIYFM